MILSTGVDQIAPDSSVQVNICENIARAQLFQKARGSVSAPRFSSPVCVAVC